MEKFGVSVPDDLAEDIEEPLEFGDSRSDRICELLELGLAVEEAAESLDIELPESDPAKRTLIRQAFLDSNVA